jgi:outer membrane receptor protein involved in Fe transport
MNRPHTYLCLAIVLTLTGQPQGGQAQERAATGSGFLEEIVVTARKREELLQDVPISMSVIPGDVLRESNIRSLEQLSSLIPSFHYGETVSGNDSIYIRGLGSGVNFGFETTVGQVFDGFFMGRARFGRGSFMDVQQIEVLKGPQGALIGKNTSAGAVLTRWRKPTDELEAYITPTWEFEGDEGYTLQGAVSGPLGADFRGRVAIRYDDKDGYYKNVVTGDDQMGFESPNVRATLDWTPTDKFDATFIYQYSKQERLGRANEFDKCSPDVAEALLPFGIDCGIDLKKGQGIWDIDGNLVDQKSDTKAHFGGLTLNWETGAGTLTSLTGYVTYDTHDTTGAAFGPDLGNLVRFQEDYEQWTQEIRFLNSDGGTFDYIVGTYLQYIPQQDLYRPLDLVRSDTIVGALGQIVGPAVPPPARLRSNLRSAQEVRTAALFAEATWYFAEQWDVSVGVRYTHEEKEIEHDHFQTALFTESPVVPPSTIPIPPAFNVHDIDDDFTENQFTPNAAVRWRPDDDTMLYAFVSTGFKGGGFDFLNTQNQPNIDTLRFNDEQVIAFEVGGKFSFPDPRVQLNVAVFRNDFDDLQVTTRTFNPVTGGTEFRTANAATAITQGVEADIRWAPIERLVFSAAGAYLDAEYDDYSDAPCFEKQTPAQGCMPVDGVLVQDLSDAALVFAPDYKFTVDGRYTHPLPNGMELFLLARGSYTDDHALQVDLDPDHFQDSYFKLDATVGLSGNNGRWSVDLIGRNLTDELTSGFGNDDVSANNPDSGSSFFFIEAPRSLSLQATVNFGGP